MNGAASKAVEGLVVLRGFESHPLRHTEEGCESGLIGAPGERVWVYAHRGFESHPFRRRPGRSPWPLFMSAGDGRERGLAAPSGGSFRPAEISKEVVELRTGQRWILNIPGNMAI